ncbi:MAG TPA: sensor histidine kinase, partial [Rhizomicrobium sp.]|nr:sensor histidine kinase [Rhizomicrobium sp.]
SREESLREANRRLEEEIKQHRKTEDALRFAIRELDHRVKNTLATVQAMAIQTMKGVDVGARDAFLARLFALSSQHDLLTMDNWEGASLEGVVRRALRPWREDEHARFRVEGPPVHLSPKRALALGMGFHELATNAAKYGALSNATGSVHVRWTILPDGKTLQFNWQECGGPPVSPPHHRGFGLRLIEHGMERELSGKVKLDFRPEGLVCIWEMKLT